MGKRLSVNVYRYGKILIFGLVLVLFSGYYLYGAYIRSVDKAVGGLLLSALVLMLVVGVVLVLYAILSFICNKAVFGEDTLTYQTLFRRCRVAYKDIFYIEAKRKTTLRNGSLFATTQNIYKLIMRNGFFEMNSFEFLGLPKQIEKISLKIDGGIRNDH